MISAKLAGKILIFVLMLLVIFHVFVLLNIIPYQIVWAGQIQNSSSLLVYEGFAILLTVLFILIISMKIGYFQQGKFVKVVKVGVWIVFFYFLLNTVGNLTSGVTTEKLIFTPLTILLTLLAFRVAIEK
jgi:hypothetical protein